MQAVREGKIGDAVLTFFPTSAHAASPSFLEINMSESLLSGLRQAIQFISAQRPDLARTLSSSSDVALTFLELHSLLRNSASVGENYMGLERVSRSGALSKAQRMASLLEVVLMPYFITDPKYRETQLLSNYKVVKSVFALLYMTNISSFSSPIHWILGIRLQRAQPRSPKNDSRFDRLGRFLVWLLVYSIQLAQWYYSHEAVLQPRHRLGKAVTEIPPPKISGLGLPADSRLCPLCLKEKTNPTASIKNGIVYCYSCIVNKLKTDGVGEFEVNSFIRRLVD